MKLFKLLLATTLLANVAFAQTPRVVENQTQLEAVLREQLAALPHITEMDARLETVPPELKSLVEANQPRSGDYLIALAINPKSELNRRAVAAVVAAIQSMSAKQITTYLTGAIILQAHLRPQYPDGFDAMAAWGYEVRHGYGGVPREFTLRTRTMHFVDDKPLPEVFIFSGPGATTGWLRTGKLALGEHNTSLQQTFEWEYNGLKGAGKVISPKFNFRIVNATVPDDLVARDSPEDEKLVKEHFKMTEPTNKGVEAVVFDGPAPAIDGFPVPDPWRPQVTWKDNQGKEWGLHGPDWKLHQTLPFALTFDVEIHVVNSRRVYKGDSVFVPAGQTYGGYAMPYLPQDFAAEQKGMVPVKVVLQPSYALALSDPKIKAFFGNQLVFENLHIKVVKPE